MFRSALVASLFLALSAQPLVAEDSSPIEVRIIKFKYEPQELKIKAGDTVRWINKEKRGYHNVWFEELGEPEPTYLFPDETYVRTFKSPGTYPYHCGPHPEMTGTVIVE